MDYNTQEERDAFMEGMYYACTYFRDELGIEDAMETDIGQEALEYFGRDS